MKRRSFISRFSLGAITSFLVAKTSFGARVKNQSPLTGGEKPFGKNKNKLVCDIARRVYKVDELSKIEIQIPAGLTEKIALFTIQKDDGDYQFGPTQMVKFSKNELGNFILEHTFPREDSYAIRIFKKDKNGKREKYPFEIQRVYALDEDLFALRPYKGDIHMHSRYSDGKDFVEQMVIKCLEMGFAFQAISDHKKYIGSAKAREIFEPLPISIKCFNAEECHQNPAPHVHSLGAKSSLHDYIDAKREKYNALVEKILKELPKDLSQAEALSVARAEGEFEMIHELGGLAGFNHPYWRMGEKCRHLPRRVIEVLCKRHKFDFLEIINSGCTDDSTDLAQEQYAQMRENGYTSSILGNSDAHSTKGIGTGYTILFAKSNNWHDVRNAVLSKQNVAVETFDNKSPRLIGSVRFIQYAYFLYQFFFPLNDKICAEQAKLLGTYLKDKSVKNKEVLSKKTAEVKNLYREFFGQ